MPIQTIDRGTAGNTGDTFKVGVAFDTCQANDEYLDLVKPTIVETFSALATTAAPTAGMVVYIKQHTSGGVGGGFFQDTAGTITNDGGMLINNTITSGRHWRRVNYTSITPDFFGAIPTSAIDNFDSTVGLFLMASFINDSGGGVSVNINDTYLIGTFDTSTLPADGGWRGDLKALTAPYGSQCQMWITGVDGVEFVGSGCIKTKDDGTPSTSILIGGSIFLLENCTNIKFDGITIDGNRQGQTHTIGSNFGHNEAISLIGETSNVIVRNCKFLNTGSRRNGEDKRGEALWMQAGVSNITIENNYIKNMGRWAFVVEGTGGEPETSKIVIKNNIYYGADRSTAPSNPDDYEQKCLGFIDFECVSNITDAVISGNTIYKSGLISLIGFTTGATPSVYKNIEVKNNTLFAQEIGGNDGYDRFIMLTGGADPSFTPKIMQNVIISNNNIIFGDENLGVVSDNRIFVAEYLTIENLEFSNNKTFQYTGSATGNDETSFGFNDCRLLGVIRFSNNNISQTSARGVMFGVKSELLTAIFGFSNCTMYLDSNIVNNSHRGVLMDKNASSIINLICTNNDITATNNNTYSLETGLVSGSYVFVNDVPLSSNVPVVVDKLSSVSVGDALLEAFTITAVDANASVVFDCIFKINDLNDTVGNLKFTAIYTGGGWTIANLISEIAATGGGVAVPTVTSTADVISIKMRKNSGGATSNPRIKGIVSLAGCELA